jgi:GTPase SAR1 family protein
MPSVLSASSSPRLLSLSLSLSHRRRLHAAAQVYDITKRKTFETLQQWVSELRAQGPEAIVLAIAGNKSDLEDERQVRTREVASGSSSNNSNFVAAPR